MTDQKKINRQILTPRIPLLENLLKAQEQLPDRTGMLLLNFWGSRGSGRTTFLQVAKDQLLKEPDMGLAGTWDANRMNVAELSQSIREAVSVRNEKFKLVLIDNLDSLLLHDADGSDFFEFESGVILPLVEKEDTLIVTGSQIEINLWQEYDVRARQENHQLLPMRADDIREILQGTSITEKQAYEITFGQPKMLELYMEHPDWTQEEVSYHARNYFLDGFSDPIKDLAQVASLFPVFNIYILRKVQGENIDDNSSLLMQYNDKINELTRHWIVQYNLQVGAFCFTDSAVRRLLARNLAINSPKRFDEIHQMAADYFQEEAKSTSYLPQLFVSAIYHLAQTRRHLTQEKCGAACLRWIKDMRLTWLGARWDQVLDVWGTGAGDYTVREEILSLVGEKYFARITKTIRENKKEAEV